MHQPFTNTFFDIRQSVIYLRFLLSTFVACKRFST